MEPCYYFGCMEDKGHFLWDPLTNWPSLKNLPADWPFGPHGEELDGGYTPKHGQKQSRALLAHVDGWTVLAMWDRTVDSRPGSNSNFVAKGELTFDEMVGLAKEHFSKVWERINKAAPVSLVEDE